MKKQSKTTERAASRPAADAAPTLPPYGLVNADNVAYLARRPVPLGFRADPASASASGANEWETWLAATAAQMAEFLWPVWTATGWVGQAAQHATELTRLDLALLQQLVPRLQDRIATQNAATARQLEAFQKEDEGEPGPTFAFYLPGVPTYLEAELYRAIATGGLDLARPASQGLKKMFQRPRPQQTATLLAAQGIVVQRSKSAITPAMISGHCIQGSLALAQVLASMWDMPPALLGSVGRFLIDTGDRRVYAGLHYPTDNIGSWYVALRMCKHLFGDKAQAVRAGLWNAIRDHSAVHAAVEAAVQTPADGLASAPALYAPMLAALQRAAQGDET